MQHPLSARSLAAAGPDALTVPIIVTPMARAPLAGDQADATCGRVVEDGLATLERIDLAEQVLHRHALHHQPISTV
jgi:hypothetical protein